MKFCSKNHGRNIFIGMGIQLLASNECPHFCCNRVITLPHHSRPVSSSPRWYLVISFWQRRLIWATVPPLRYHWQWRNYLPLYMILGVQKIVRGYFESGVTSQLFAVDRWIRRQWRIGAIRQWWLQGNLSCGKKEAFSNFCGLCLYANVAQSEQIWVNKKL